MKNRKENFKKEVIKEVLDVSSLILILAVFVIIYIMLAI